MKELLEHIESLKKAFAKLQPLSTENQQRLDKKFRLEWNYNSNHIEGNTLTYGETELLLIFDKTKGDHDKREYDEMQGHDVALKLVSDLAVDSEREMNEKFIRELNQLILVKPFYKEAILPDGQPTRRLIKIGDYKSFPNSVRLQNGEIFHYPSPTETPALMGDLVAWYLQTSLNQEIHPIEVAAELHYKFVCIHPFDDGNGRISRLLMNYHLIKNGYPPVIIKSGDKKKYLFALQEADTGNIEAFKIYIAEQLLWSYEISIKAAKSESIDEPGDWEKKIKQLNTKFDKSQTIEKIKNSLSIAEVLFNTLIPLSETFLSHDFALNKLFIRPVISLVPGKIGSGNFYSFYDLKIFLNSFSTNQNTIKKDTEFIDFAYILEHFKKNGSNSFSLTNVIRYNFLKYSCQILLIIDDKDKSIVLSEKFYHQKITEKDKEPILNIITEHVIQQIEEKIKTPLN